MHDELVALERLPEGVIDGEVLGGTGLQLVVEVAPAVAGAHGLAHGGVGFAKEPVRGCRALVRDGDADGGV